MRRTQHNKVLIYCQDSLGLGHLRRNINIAHELYRQDPSTQILFLADSPLAPFFKLPPSGDFIKLPTVVKVDAGVWQAHKLPRLNIERTWQLRSQLIKQVASQYKPNILLVDHMPQGASRELLPCLQMLRAELPNTRNIVGLRDILGAPDVIKRQWSIEGAYDMIRQYYDHVLVYGTPDIYDLPTDCDFPSGVREKVQFCGYVSPNLDHARPLSKPLAEQFPEKRPFTLLVMGGGGSDAHFFMDTFLNTLRYLGNDIVFNTLVLTGPFMPEPAREALRQKAFGLPVLIKQMEDDSLGYYDETDLVVSMAGYNTTCEVLRFRKKAIMVPRAGPSAEQGMRCKILHERDLIHSIHPTHLTVQKLADVIMARLHEEERPLRQYPRLDGAANAAQYILEPSSIKSCIPA
ncbi:MAG: glycosyltransferase [Chloroflexota bacterium]